MSRLERLAERITPMLLLFLAVGGTLLIAAPRRAGADPNNANCKPNRATCTANHQCCSGACIAGLCATPPTTTTTTATTSTTTTTAPMTTTTTTTTSSTTTTTARFVDNGDGTVTDDLTGLQWEKKDNTCPGIHCVSDTYTWCVPATLTSGCANGGVPDGTAFTSFLATLNGGATGVGNCQSDDGSSQTGGFVNHCDWRLPTIVELRTIMDTSASGCGTGSPCIDATFGPTAASNYWSSTSWDVNPKFVWSVGFNDGSVNIPAKADGRPSVRAVRGGCACTGGEVLDPSGMCVCPTGQTEDVSGTCQCSSGTKCNGTCKDTQTDNNNCGTCGNVCGAGQVCNSGSCCTPATSCPAGDNCGTASDGCGGTLTCGTCTGFDTCGGGGVPNQCGCTPVTCGPTQCGSIPDGCGGEIPCPCS